MFRTGERLLRVMAPPFNVMELSKGTEGSQYRRADKAGVRYRPSSTSHW